MNLINTRETDYAIRLIRALNAKTAISTQQICESEQIPLKFAYKIIAKLDKAGWIEVSRGARGGCRIKTDLRRKTVLDLMEAMGRKPLISPCLEEGYVCEWKTGHQCSCTFSEEFARLQEELDHHMREKSIQEIIDQTFSDKEEVI